MSQIFYQGYLDSLCGIYSIINADKIVNSPPLLESQNLFNSIIHFLDKKKILKDVILEGTDQSLMRLLMKNVAGSRFPVKISNRKNFKNLREWWSYSRNFLDEGENRTIIISLGGKLYHLSVIERITDRTIFLKDSDKGWKTLKKSMCRLAGYSETDKYIIYPSQCWYLGKE